LASVNLLLFFATHQLQTANQSTAASINLLFFFATDQSQMANRSTAIATENE